MNPSTKAAKRRKSNSRAPSSLGILEFQAAAPDFPRTLPFCRAHLLLRSPTHPPELVQFPFTMRQHCGQTAHRIALSAVGVINTALWVPEGTLIGINWCGRFSGRRLENVCHPPRAVKCTHLPKIGSIKPRQIGVSNPLTIVERRCAATLNVSVHGGPPGAA